MSDRLARRLARLRGAGEEAAALRRAPSMAEAEPAREPELKPVPVPDAEVARPSGAPDVEALKRSIRRILERSAAREAARPPPGPPEPLPGETLETDRGPVRRVLTVHEPHHCHGRVPAAGALTVDGSALAALAGQPELAGLDLSRAVFVDTETTGLSGGTGTVPFLVGVGFFEDESFVVEQLLLEELGDEPALIGRVKALLEASSCLVTFNGKAYDAPLLATRAVMAKVGAWPSVPHVDLLHLARRSYRWRLRALRLVELEREVLGFQRTQDIDGAEVPATYWSFLRSGQPSFLLPVLEHNLHDIVALAALMAEIVGGYAIVDSRHDPEDQACRARWALRCADHDRVLAFASAVRSGGADPEVAFEACMTAAVSARRCGESSLEREWLDAALEHATNPEGRARLHLERAKHFEHRGRELGAALREAEALFELSPSPAVQHRVDRLRRRLERTAGSPVNGSGPKRPPPAPALAAPPPTTREARLRSAIAALRPPAG